MAHDSISPPDYDPSADADRRKAIAKAGDGGKAIQEALGVFYSIKALAEILTQDTIRDNDAWVLGIGNSLVEHADVMIEFLDRPMGWPELDDERDGGGDLREQTIAEIRADHPGADEREIKLRVAIRESICMTPDEEQRAYELISAAVRS